MLEHLNCEQVCCNMVCVRATVGARVYQIQGQ